MAEDQSELTLPDIPAELQEGLLAPLAQQELLDRFDVLTYNLPLVAIHETKGDDTEVSLMHIVPVAVIRSKYVDVAPAVDAQLAEMAGSIGFTEIIDAVAHELDVDKDDLQRKTRQEKTVTPRHIGMYLVRRLTGMSYPKIGKAFGGFDHTTVRSAVGNIARDLGENQKLRSQTSKVLATLFGENSSLVQYVIDGESVSAVVFSPEGLFICPTFTPDDTDRFITGDRTLGLEWSQRETNDELWVRFGPATAVRLDELARQSSE